jgi:hypothetical protein
MKELIAAAKYYAGMGFSVIPIDSGKRPIGRWKIRQSVAMTPDEAEAEMLNTNASAVGLVGGTVSGNLEIIDFDEKYYPGISMQIMAAIDRLMPEHYKRIRIHRTTSGGYHMLMRSDSPVMGNKKLANRAPNEKELELSPKLKKVCFLETRGEGGYAVAVGVGYSIHQDVPIPTFTHNDFVSILEICSSFNEVVDVIKAPYKPRAADKNFYSTNPWADYDERANEVDLMHDLGWKLESQSNKFLWFTRPGKTSGVSMSFNRETGFFYCFTSSTDLEPEKGYRKSSLLCQLKFDNDAAACTKYLTDNGFGCIAPKFEKRMVQRAATTGAPLPANLSESAGADYEKAFEEFKERFPHGMFWEPDYENDGVIISREKVRDVALGLGFQLYKNDLVRVCPKPSLDDPNPIKAKVIEMVTERSFFDALRDYIYDDDTTALFAIRNAWEAFIERHGKFTISRLPIMPDGLILEDSATHCYKCYQNNIVIITANGKTYGTYDGQEKYIWRHKILPRDFIPFYGGIYTDFLEKAIGEITPYIKKCIGYLIHDYKRPDSSYMVVLTEKCENPKDGGGSGKSLFSKLLSHVISYMSFPASQARFDKTLLQSWRWQRVVCISDLPEKFDLVQMKAFIDDDIIQKLLFINDAIIKSADAPKFLAQTNYSVVCTDGGVKRRTKIIEFSDFFTVAKGVNTHYNGVYFPDGWTDNDWRGFDTFLAGCIQEWLAAGRKIEDSELTDGGWLKQFTQEYGRTISDFIKENIGNWVLRGEVPSEEFQSSLIAYYQEYNISAMHQPSAKKINDALKSWCGRHGISFKGNEQRWKHGKNGKYKIFMKIEATTLAAIDAFSPFYPNLTNTY